jgi:hypothetical protein
VSCPATSSQGLEARVPVGVDDKWAPLDAVASNSISATEIATHIIFQTKETLCQS